MKYTVVWAPAAEKELASISVNSADRAAIAEAANVLDDEITYLSSDRSRSIQRSEAMRIVSDFHDYYPRI